MPDGNKNIERLIFRFLQERCTEAELQQLQQWISRSEDNRKQFEDLTNLRHLSSELEKLSGYNDASGWEKIKTGFATVPIPEKRIRIWPRIAAAAIAVCIIGSFYLLTKTTEKPNAIIARATTHDVLPGSNKATLTLSDGSVISLDDSQGDTIAQQGNTKIFNLKGKLSYSKATPTNEILYNTISTPAGGQYQVILPDGSQVWLNASSSITFPTAFTGRERSVDITGEAYLEVKHDKKIPFTVNVNESRVQVLGTSFNVMAYSNEVALEVTLLQGSVNFSTDETQTLLKPGEQSRLTKAGSVKVAKEVDIEKIMAWKNGFFYFDNAGIEDVMRQLARWYDVKIIYRNTSKGDLFHADIPRNMKLSEVLKALELAGDLHFEIQGRNIIVI